MTSSRLSRMVESLRKPLSACASRAAISLRIGRPCGAAAASLAVEADAPEMGPSLSESAGIIVSLGLPAPYRIGTWPVGIGDPQPLQQGYFQRFHPIGLFRILVIVAQQV